MNYKVLTEPACSYEILSLPDAKSQLMITHDEFDAKIQSCIDAAIEVAQDYTGRRFYPATMVAWAYDWKRCFTIVRGPNIEITSVKYYKEGETALTDVDESMYTVVDRNFDTDIIFSNDFTFDCLEKRADAIQIEFSCGFEKAADIPKRIFSAIVLLTRDLFTTGNRVDEKISQADNLLLPYRCQR